MNTKLKIFSIASLLAVAGCGSPDEGRTTDGGSGESATVQGALSSESSAESASEAELFFVGEDGSMESASRTDVSAEGRYTFDVDIKPDTEGERTLVVRAYDQARAEIGSVVADRIVAANETITMTPMDTESHMETRLIVEARASGECEVCSVESTRAFINAQVATQAESSEEEFERIRTAFVARAEAQAEILMEADGNVREEIRTSLNAALKARDESVAMAETDAEREDALEAFEEARIAAYLESSASIDILARAFQAGSAATEASATGSAESSNGLNAMWLHAESEAATFVRLKTDEHDFPDESSQMEARSAGDELESDIEAIVATSANVKAEFESAWSDYAASIRAELTAGVDLATYTALQQLQSSFESAQTAYVEAVANGEDAASAQGELFAAVTTETNVQALTTAGMTEANAETHLEILAHLMLESELPELPEDGGI